MGMELITEMARVTLPARVKDFVFQLLNFKLTLSMRFWYKLDVIRLWIEGAPRYLSIFLVRGIPLIATISSANLMSTPWEKQILDF